MTRTFLATWIVVLLCYRPAVSFAGTEANETASDDAAIAPAASATCVGSCNEEKATLHLQYVELAMLHVADVITTRAALKAGGHEQNPLVAPIAGNVPALLAVKSASTIATIYAVNHLARQRPVLAKVLMVAINASLTAIVVHNTLIAGSPMR